MAPPISNTGSPRIDTTQTSQAEQAEHSAPTKKTEPRPVKVDQHVILSILAGLPQPQRPAETTPRENAQSSAAATGYADELKAKLAADPDYRLYSDQIAKLRTLLDANGLDSIDAAFGDWLGGGKNDGLIDWDNIQHAAADENAPGHAVAVMLSNNPGLFQLIDADDNKLISAKEVRAAIDGLKAKLKEIEKEIKESMPPPPTQATTQAGGTTGNAGGSSGASESSGSTAGSSQAGGTKAAPKDGEQSSTAKYDELKKKAAPPYALELTATDTQGKLDQTGKYLDDWQASLQDQIFKAASEGDNATVTALQAQLSRIQMAQQALQQMQQQMFTMMSNMLKMYGDMAMTAINNSR